MLRALLEDFHTAPISEAEHRMLAYAEQLTRDPSSVSEDQIHELRASGWGDGAIHDMAQVVAYYNYVNRVADGLGVTLEEGWPEQWP